MKRIFEYTDYRLFLADYYAQKRAQNPGFSYRFIAGNVGFKSAGHFTKIIQRKANISVQLALRFAEFFKLNKKQTEYFQSLVLYNQAKNHSDKRRYFEKLMSFKQARIVTVNASQYELYEKWYYTVVREILAFFLFKDNFRELAAMVDPTISEGEARKAIEVLERNGFIAKNADGYYKQIDPLIMASRETSSLAIDNFIVSNLDLARQAIDNFPKDRRKLSATTITISRATYGKIINELRDFREHILSMAQQDKNPDRSYQFNFQVFPVSRNPDMKDRP
jgi:uncharacterized protein (TIGR02147 family)